MKEAVVLIPGIMGSVLMDGETVVWPGNPLELLLPYRHMDSLLSPDLIASDVIRKVSISTQYQDLIETLGGFGFEEKVAIPNLKVFPYDWRKDNAQAAAALAGCIDDFIAVLGDETEIHLVAHSMGGLVSRFYLESGMFDRRPGFPRIKNLITIGTPHRGSPMALSAATGLEKRLFLSAAQVKAIASDENFPSLYQLLPQQGDPFAWDRTSGARFDPINIYDTEVYRKIGLSPKNLESAKNFHEHLDLSKRPKNVRYFFFAGNRKATTNSVQIKESSIRKEERDGSGDGTVPVWSGLLPGVQCELVGGEHGELYKGSKLKQVLGLLLGMEEMQAFGAVPELSVMPKVVNPDQTYTVTVDLPKGTSKIDGELRLRRLVTISGGIQSNATPINTQVVSYSGPLIDHLTVLLGAPKFPGVYEISIVLKEDIESVASVELFVQEL